MATDEGAFKLEFKKDLEGHLSGKALLWSSSDRYTSGLPDFFILDSGHFVAVEAKFTKTLPKKKTSLVLSHEVSPAQKRFLDRAKDNGHTGLIVIGTPQSAVVFTEIKLNYTLEECLLATKFLRQDGMWQLGGFHELWRK